MGGRGGRGGRGGKPVSAARLLLQRSAHEAGLDDSNLRALHDITSTGLYTDLQWHSSGRGLWVPAEEPDNIPTALPMAISEGSGAGAIDVDGTEGGADVKAEPDTQQQQQKQAPPAAAPPQIPETNRTMTCITAPATTVLAKTKRLPTVTYMTNKQRELIAKWQASGHYVRPSQQVDVIRYSTYYKSNRIARSVVQAVLNTMRANTTTGTVGAAGAAGVVVAGVANASAAASNKLAMDEQYIPSELIQSGTTFGRLKKIHGKKSERELERLAQEESTNPGIAAAAAAARAEEGGEGDEFDDDVLEEQAEEEDGEDYVTNHYASDDDDGGGDDDGGEPTF
jgi:hypothetical protein